MLQMGMQYGQAVLQQGLQQGLQHGEQGLLRYMPFFTNFRVYFTVDNNYVKRKLGIVSFPFIRKFPKTVDAAGGGGGFAGPAGNEYGGENTEGGYGSSSPLRREGVSPTTMYPAPIPSRKTLPLPTHDAFAFDLYIPLMAAVTYVTFSAFLSGMRYHRSITAEYLVSITTTIAMSFCVETLALKLFGYLLRVLPSMAVLDIISLTGYKYVLISFVVLLRQLTRLQSVLLYLCTCVLYVIAANSFFTVKTLLRFYTRDDGRVPPRAQLFAYIAAALQAPAIIWMSLRPFWE